MRHKDRPTSDRRNLYPGGYARDYRDQGCDQAARGPDTAKEKPQEGTVLAVGPGRIDDKGNRIPVDVKVGETVLYSKYGGTEVKYAGEEYLVLSARDVLAVIEK
jgi:co-chaperonin GroES (HSP10)